MLDDNGRAPEAIILECRGWPVTAWWRRQASLDHHQFDYLMKFNSSVVVTKYLYLNTSEHVRTHPNTSEHVEYIGTRPNTSEHVTTHVSTSESAYECLNVRRGTSLYKVVDVVRSCGRCLQKGVIGWTLIRALKSLMAQAGRHAGFF